MLRARRGRTRREGPGALRPGHRRHPGRHLRGSRLSRVHASCTCPTWNSSSDVSRNQRELDQGSPPKEARGCLSPNTPPAPRPNTPSTKTWNRMVLGPEAPLWEALEGSDILSYLLKSLDASRLGHWLRHPEPCPLTSALDTPRHPDGRVGTRVPPCLKLNDREVTRAEEGVVTLPVIGPISQTLGFESSTPRCMEGRAGLGRVLGELSTSATPTLLRKRPLCKAPPGLQQVLRDPRETPGRCVS